MTMLDAALALAARGWRIFPCDPHPEKPRSKRPLVVADKDANGKSIEGTGWPKKASADPAQIRAWWARWPNALIGMAPGWAGGYVVDLDPKGEPVEAVEARLAEALGAPLPRGVRTITQSGGRHLWFRRPEGEHFPNDPPGLKNIDIRCDGGYVILPPSVLANGNSYAWENGEMFDPATAPDVPARLLELIAGRKLKPHGDDAQPGLSGERGPARALASDQPGEEAKRRYARAALDRIAADLARAQPGQRGTDLYAAACALGRFIAAGVVSEREALAALEDGADANGLRGEDGSKRVAREIARGLDAGRCDAAGVIARLEDVAREAERRRGGARAPQAPLREPDSDHYPDPGERFDACGHDADGGPGESPAPDDDAPDDARADDPGDMREPDGPVDMEVVRRCAGLPLNDTGNAHRLIEWFGADLLYAREQGWMVWTGTHWDLAGGEAAAMLRAQWVAPRIALEARVLERHANEDEKGFDARQQARRRFAATSGNSGRCAAMLAMALPHLARAPEEFDANPMMVAVRNGVLVFRREADPECPDPDVVRWRGRAVFRAHDRAHLNTKYMPVDYNPQARCPSWDGFMARFQPKAVVRRFLQVFHGLGLTGRTVQVLMFHYGSGANGKSTFINGICDLMGAYAQQLSAESITGQGQRRGDQATPDLARLPGARLARISELPRGEPLKEALIKTLTGGEPMPVRHLNKGFFDFTPEFKATMSGNDLPTVSGVDHGIWRRLRLVPWEVTIPDAEQREMSDVLAEFAAERSGILNWLIAGTMIFLAEGLVTPPEVSAATAEYREEMDPLGGFIADCVERVDPARNESVTAREMYEAYVSWSAANAKRAWKETNFGRAMPHKGFERENKRVRRYLNCRLHDVPMRPSAASRSPHEVQPDD